jgi:hypothetical protein
MDRHRRRVRSGIGNHDAGKGIEDGRPSRPRRQERLQGVFRPGPVWSHAPEQLHHLGVVPGQRRTERVVETVGGGPSDPSHVGGSASLDAIARRSAMNDRKDASSIGCSSMSQS